MHQISDIIIADTSCLIILLKIDELELLKRIASCVYVTPAIYEEFGKALPNWIKIKAPKDEHYLRIIETELDAGEASAIALSLELENSIVLLDDLKGRKFAEKLQIKYSGTFGAILNAKQIGVITRVKPIIEKIRKTDFRFSEQLFKIILEQAGE